MANPCLLIMGFYAAFSALVLCASYADRPDKIEIRAEALKGFDLQDPAKRHFGVLEYQGGLVLTSSSKLFGGISALRVQPDGERFLALTDHGFWLRGRIVYRGECPLGITDAEMAPILGAEVTSSRPPDTESIAQDGGIVYVGIERSNSILRLDYGKQGLLAKGRAIEVPPGIKTLPANQGLEAMVFVPRGGPLGGTLIAISEYGLDELGNIKAFLIGGPSPGVFTIKRTGGYAISDAALLPDGDLLVLERQYLVEKGLAVRIRSIPMTDVKPEALVDGPVLIEAVGHFQIENLEGLSVHRAPSGKILLTLISDDNFWPIQRTILLQFALAKN